MTDTMTEGENWTILRAGLFSACSATIRIQRLDHLTNPLMSADADVLRSGGDWLLPRPDA